MTPGTRAARSMTALESITASLTILAAKVGVEIEGGPRGNRDPLIKALFAQEWAANALEKITTRIATEEPEASGEGE